MVLASPMYARLVVTVARSVTFPPVAWVYVANTRFWAAAVTLLATSMKPAPCLFLLFCHPCYFAIHEKKKQRPT